LDINRAKEYVIENFESESSHMAAEPAYEKLAIDLNNPHVVTAYLELILTTLTHVSATITKIEPSSLLGIQITHQLLKVTTLKFFSYAVLLWNIFRFAVMASTD